MSIPQLQTGALTALAASLGADADRLRRLASSLATAARDVVWQSVAADACRARLAEYGGLLLRLAGSLADASADVTRHRLTAQRRADELLAAAAAAAAAAASVAAAAAAASSAASTVVDNPLVGGLAGTVSVLVGAR